MTCDEEDLEKLGFVEEPLIYPKHAWENLTTPVLASAVSALKYYSLVSSSMQGFIQSSRV